ncbi:uncharacterized protein BDZ83DRAFT_654489 [Colletotrichum acutatum]|uniref:Uncharacterized protein n=1 Tax=Glomerella acutata TaxID=27357 RepID=A0AAD8XFP0_GLOAC|nr:uncharacterized protein BDZ83DRAFT_654489 [Colletotrichum acutatum]KAK1720299.1 hypothetical protein BDZ83DRAFT_654489 [Colletotrichum acutatum]
MRWWDKPPISAKLLRGSGPFGLLVLTNIARLSLRFDDIELLIASRLGSGLCELIVSAMTSQTRNKRGFLDALASFNKNILQTASVVIGHPSSGCRVPEWARVSPLVRLEMLNRHVDAPLLEHRQDFWDVALGDGSITYCTSPIVILLTKLRSEPLRARSSTRNVTEFWGHKQLVPHIRRLVPHIVRLCWAFTPRGRSIKNAKCEIRAWDDVRLRHAWESASRLGDARS